MPLCLASRRLVPPLAEEYTWAMDLDKMLAELRAERDQVDEVILALQRIAAGRGRRRGRPRAWVSNVKRRGRPPGSKNKPKEES